MKLTGNFSLEEFTCKHCDCVKVNLVFEQLVHNLQRLRDAWGSPINVTSGYRCQCYNWHLRQPPWNYNTAQNSQHIKGCAADIKPNPSRNLIELYQLIERQGLFSFVKLYDSHIHVDMRGLFHV